MKAVDLPPTLREFGLAPINSESPTPDIPVPKRVARLLREQQRQQELFEKRRQTLGIIPADDATGQGPERLIGPRNPEHPAVNNGQGGRSVD
jgi:hypothetical protein